jgi:hypothetical protein
VAIRCETSCHRRFDKDCSHIVTLAEVLERLVKTFELLARDQGIRKRQNAITSQEVPAGLR